MGSRNEPGREREPEQQPFDDGWNVPSPDPETGTVWYRPDPEPEPRSDPGSPFEPEPEPRFHEYGPERPPNAVEQPVEPVRIRDQLPEQPKRTNVPIVPIQPVSMEPVHEYPQRHVHPVTVVHPPTIIDERGVQNPASTSEVLTHVEQKELTPVKQSEPGKISEKLTNPPQNVNFPVKSSDNFSGPGPVKKLPKKMQFKGKKGRQRTEAEVIDLLTFVQARNGAWPNDNYVSDQMRRYYRREYPEYFRKSRKKGNTGKVPAVRLAPIDIQARRRGTV